MQKLNNVSFRADAASALSQYVLVYCFTVILYIVPVSSWNSLPFHFFRLEQSKQLVKSFQQKMLMLEKETETQRQVWRDEMWSMKSEVATAQKKMEAARANNHRTLMRNQQLREKFVIWFKQ